jgi:selenide,water dikinase
MVTEQNLCPCAGERPESAPSTEIRLTTFVSNAGSASQIPAAELNDVLAQLPVVDDPAIIPGLATADNAAIYRLAEDVCLVQTVDLLTPCVDDARMFGQICAANCLSDVYALGAKPRTAMSLLAFPTEKLPGEIVLQMLSGAMEKFLEAGVTLIGGHSVKDAELKLGFVITGVVDPVSVASQQLQVGDALVLTKPLGTGVLTFGLQIGREFPEGLAAAAASMATLNQAAAEALRESGASACTDVSGYGLFAQLQRMLRSSGLGVEVFADALPAFVGVLGALREGVIPGAIERNREYVGGSLLVGPGVDEAVVNLGFDAQTSGGLLIAIPPARLNELRQRLTQRGVGAFVIGKIAAGGPAEIVLMPGAEFLHAEPVATTPAYGLQPNIATPRPRVSPAAMTAPAVATSPVQSRVALPPVAKNPLPENSVSESLLAGEAGAVGTAAGSQNAFGALLRSVQAAGALNEKTKELILFSHMVASRSAPGFETRLGKARALGITQAELDEAAWCAIALGGAPVEIFYQECLGQHDNPCNGS